MAASLGIAGLGALASLAAYRNYFMTLALLALGYSFFAALRRKLRAGTLSLKKYRFGRDDWLLLITTGLVGLAIFFPQIRAATREESGATYEGRGSVVSVDEKANKITLKHEEIKGLMRPMTMEFSSRSAEMLDGLRPADGVRFTLRSEGAGLVIETIDKEEKR